MIKTVIFDMDGLMFDTERLSNEAFYAIADKLGIVVKQEMLDELKGSNKKRAFDILRSYFGEDADLDHILSVRQEYIDRHMEANGVPVKAGLKELLSFLKTHHYNVVLATSTGREKAMKLLKMADVKKYFDYMIFGDAVENSKPDPEIFLKAAKKSYTDPENCLVLEDSLNGVEAAHRAGMHVIMIPDTIAPNDHMKEIADDIVDSLEDILNWMRSTEKKAV